MEVRHEGHRHTANIKYGHFIALVSLAHVGCIVLSRTVLKKYRLNNRIGLVAIFLLWSIIIIGTTLINVDLSESYKTSIKRIGRLSYCLIPFDIFLILRPNFPIIRYLELIDLHKWMSRLIIACGLIHGVGYMVVWSIEGTLMVKSLKLLNFYGVIVFLANCLLLIISIGFFRRRNYPYFYIIHNLTVWLFVYLISFHARPGVSVYTLVITLLLGYQFYKKIGYLTTLKLHQHESSNLKIIELQNNFDFSPGSHIRLSYSYWDYRCWAYPTHPYTIAHSNLDSVYLVVKPYQFDFNASSKYCLTGPFNSTPDQFWTNSENISIVVGGSGISFGLPILTHLLAQGKLAHLFWSVKSQADLYILNALNINHLDHITVHITGNEDEESFGLLSNDEIELQSLSNSNIKIGRFSFTHLVSQLNKTNDDNKKWLVACGPEPLVIDAKKFANNKKIQILTEIYSI